MYRYNLEKYGGQNRYTCPKCRKQHCFTRYIDMETNQYLADDVGMCDHKNSCGYHKPPREYFKEHGNEHSSEYRQHSASIRISEKPKEEEKETNYIPMGKIEELEKKDRINPLKEFLLKYFPSTDLQRVFSAYYVGTTKNGEAIFPQIDIQGRCRTAKIMAYDESGHRIKSEKDGIDWLHARYARIMKKKGLKPSDWNLKQCLFGEHLLSSRPDDVVVLVESEKTAIICALKYPKYIWLACGGKQNLKPEMCQALAGRNVLLCPDADAVADWEERSKRLSFCQRVDMFDWYEDEPEGSKRDIADCILEEAQKETEPEETQPEETQPEVKPTTFGDVCQWMSELRIEKDRVHFNI